MHNQPAVSLNHVELQYRSGGHALKDVSLRIDPGEFVFLVGATGSGKSSILKLLYREFPPTSGEVFVHGVGVHQLSLKEIPHYRRQLGVIFQDFKLLPNKTAAQNVAYALEVTGAPSDIIPDQVRRCLSLVDLEDKMDRLPTQLSGGEQQRVAIARALVNNPNLIIADEPTGNLDPDSTWSIVRLLKKIHESGATLVVATHDQQVVNLLKKRVVVMRDGLIVRDSEHSRYTLVSEESYEQ